jgi:hypothetical protein
MLAMIEFAARAIFQRKSMCGASLVRSSRVIVVGPNGWASLEEILQTTGRHKALGYHKQWWKGVRFFHSDGFVYEVESADPERPLGALSKILAMTVYNPWLQLKYTYRKVVAYSLEELKGAVAAAIREDDDILTQFEDESALMNELSEAKSFQSVAAVIRRGTGRGKHQR